MNFLKKLFSKPAPPPPDVPPEFLQENSPNWLIDLKAKQLPDGDVFSVRVQLFQQSRIGTAEILVLPRNQSGLPTSVIAKLSSPELDRLLVILGFSFADEIASVPGAAAEGLSTSLSIYRQDPFTLRTAVCNLAGWLNSRKPAPPAIEIACLLLDVRNRSLSS